MANVDHIVWQGTLRLNKTGGVAAINNGNMNVGDFVGVSGADQLILLGSEQIANSVPLRVWNSGKADIGTFTETVGSIDIRMGANAQGLITVPQARSSLLEQ